MLLHWCLRPARLPIPPSGHLFFVCVCKGKHNFLNTQEKMLIELFRQAPETVQRHILAGLLTQNTTAPTTGNIVTVGNNNDGNVAGKDIYLK